MLGLLMLGADLLLKVYANRAAVKHP